MTLIETPTIFGRSKRTSEANREFDLEAARRRLNSYSSRLGKLSREDREFVLSYKGPEVAGKPGQHDK